jgi:hypothetical protein
MKDTMPLESEPKRVLEGANGASSKPSHEATSPYALFLNAR